MEAVDLRIPLTVEFATSATLMMVKWGRGSVTLSELAATSKAVWKTPRRLEPLSDLSSLNAYGTNVILNVCVTNVALALGVSDDDDAATSHVRSVVDVATASSAYVTAQTDVNEHTRLVLVVQSVIGYLVTGHDARQVVHTDPF